MRFLHFTPILFTTTFLLASRTMAEEQSFCFEIQIAKVSKYLMLHLNNDGWKTGWVRYAGQSGTIPICRKRETVLSSPPGRPSDVRYDYEELQGGKATGQYTFTLQGAAFGDAYYKRYRDQKKFVIKKYNGADDDCLK